MANFALAVAVTRMLAAADAGVFFTVTSLFLVAEAVARLGADVGLVYWVARWRALGQDANIRAGLRVALGPVTAACTAAALLVLVFAPQFDGWVGRGSDATWLLRSVALVLPVAAVYDVMLGATRGFGSMRATVVVDRVLRPVLQLALVGVVLAIGADRGVGIAWAAPWLVGIVLVVATLRRRLPAARPAAVRSLRGDFWRFAAPRALASVAQLLLQRLDIVLVAALRGPVDAAVYTAATRFLVAGQFVNQAITGPVQPRLSSSMASGDSSASRTLYQISTAWVVIISWPIFCAAIVLAPLYLRVFGHGYHGYSGAVTVVVLLAGAMLVASGVGVVDSVIIMAGRSSWNLATTLVALAVNVAVDVALIPHLGIVGAAIGWGAAILASNVVPLIMAWRLLGMHPFGRNVLSACALSVVCFLGIPELAEVVSGDGQLAAAAGTMVGGVLYVVVLLRKHRQFALDAFLPGRFRRRSAEAGATR